MVIGAGFIGSEVAATCQGLGAEVTLLEAYHTPLARVLGDEMGRACADLHVANGMDLRCNITIDHLEPDPGGPDPVTVCLDDGTRHRRPTWWWWVSAWSPAVGWLDGSGLTLENGVWCDGSLFAADRVVAAGDVANWVRPSTGRPARVEHWTNAAEGGAAAARNLLAGTDAAVPYDPVPFFWSDQYTTKIQMIGLPGPGRRGGGGQRLGLRGEADRPLPLGGPARAACCPSASRPSSWATARCWPPGPRSTRRWPTPGPDGRRRRTDRRGPSGLPPPRAGLGMPRKRRVTVRAAAIWSALGSMPP